MSTAAAAAEPHVIQTETTELFGKATNGKIGMWIFLLSDAFSFFGLLLAYGILRSGSTVWRHAGEPELNIGFAALLTLDLILSTVFMVLAFTAAVENNRKRLTLFLSLTILGGLIFLGGQAKEYTDLIHEGLVFGHSSYANTFYAITSFHGLHVTIGVVYLIFTLVRANMGKYDNGQWAEVELVDLFWHFVDLVWIFVFTFIYLLPATGA